MKAILRTVSDALIEAVCAVVWWMSWPVRVVVRRRLSRQAREHEELAGQLASLDRHRQAYDAWAVAAEYRQKAARW